MDKFSRCSLTQAEEAYPSSKELAFGSNKPTCKFFCVLEMKGFLMVKPGWGALLAKTECGGMHPIDGAQKHLIQQITTNVITFPQFNVFPAFCFPVFSTA